MENRFSFKDLFLFVLLIVVLVSVWLAMKQFDRQWGDVKAIRVELEEQRRELRALRDRIPTSFTLAPQTTTTQTTGVQPTTGSAVSPVGVAPGEVDPFERVSRATTQPGFSRGDWLVDSFGNSVGKLTPLLSSDVYARTVESYVLESLADRDPVTLAWKPLLAESWRVVDNIKAYDTYVAKRKSEGATDEEISKEKDLPSAIQIVFKMRPGVRFSDGTPLTADDVVFSYEFPMNEKVNAPRARAYLSRFRSVEKTAPDEVTFSFAEPYFEAFELAASLSVMPRHFYSQFSFEDFNNSVGYLMGSGPYRLENPTSWKPGTLIQLVRNENYWGTTPALDRMVWKEITSDIAEMASFRNGDTDLFAALPDQYREMVKDEALLKRAQNYEFQNPVGGYRYIAWNQKTNDGKPSRFADKRVRQAMTLLIDRERLIQEISLGYGVLSTGPFNPLSKQFNPDVVAWPFNIERGRALLKDAGFEDRDKDGVLESTEGVPFEFKLTYPGGNANYERMALSFKDSYARAGIVLKPDPLDWAVLVERLNKKNFDAISLGWSAGIESDIFQMFHSTQSMNEGDNFVSYKSDDLDATISEARRTLDEAKRMTLWRKAHAILNEDQPYTFLSFGKNLLFVDRRFENVELTKIGLNPRVEWFVPAGGQRWTK